MKHHVSFHQLMRHLLQAAAFLLFPGAFLSVFQSLRSILTSLVSDSFAFTEQAPSLVLLTVILLSALIGGRVFCGYLCSFGAAQEITGLIAKRRHTVSGKTDRILKYLKYAVLAFIVLFVWIFGLAVDSSLSPWSAFGALVSGNLSVAASAVLTVGGIFLLILLVCSLFIERFFCRYCCPLGALLSVVSRVRFFGICRDEARCTHCGACSRNCPMGIPVSEQKNVSSGECICCMRCTEACPAAALGSRPHAATSLLLAVLLLVGMLAAVSLSVPVSAADPVEPEISDPVPEPATEVTESEPKPQAEVTEPEPEPGPESEEEQAEAAEPDIVFTDGVYTGTGMGLRGIVEVRVTVENSAITDITVLSFSDDPQYFNSAEAGMIQRIIREQSTGVDTVTGATYSSNGILEAVADALGLDFVNPNTSLTAGHSGKNKH